MDKYHTLPRKILLNQGKLNHLLRQWKEYDEKKNSGGLWERARQLFKHAYDYNQMTISLAEIIDQINQDWGLLSIFVKCVIFSSNADDFMQNRMSVFENIHGMVKEIDRVTWSSASEHESFSPEKMLSLLVDCKRKTDELIETAIREAVKVLSKSPIRADVYYHSGIWISFLPFIRENMWLFNDAGNDVIGKTLAFLYSELLSIGRVQNRYRIYTLDGFLFNEMFSNATSVIVRIVVHCCNFWFNGKDPEIANVVATEIVGLVEEIDPTNMEFLQFDFAFLKSVFLVQLDSKRRLSDAVYLFCRYLLNWFDRKDLEKNLRSLVTLFIHHRLEEREEDMHKFFAEVKAVLFEVAFSHRTVQRDLEVDSEQDPMDRDRQELAAEKERNLAAKLPPSSNLLAKICLLKAELFLKQQLKSHNSSMLSSDDRFFKIDMILTDLRAYKKDQCQQVNTEFLEKSLVLTEELANEIESLHKLLSTKKITSFSAKHSLLLWLFRIIFLKAESSLAELLKSIDSSIAHHIQYLLKELTYFEGILKTTLLNVPSDDETVLLQLEDVAREITLLSFPHLPDHKKFKKIVQSLPQLLNKVNDIKAKLPKIRQHLAKSIFPKTFDLGFFDFLYGNIRKLLKHDLESITPVKHHFEEVLNYMDSLKSFLVQVKDSGIDLGELKVLKNHIIDAAYKLEFAVESIEVDGGLCQLLWLYDVLEDIRHVDQQVRKIPEMSYPWKKESISQISSQMMSRDTIPDINEKLVDLVDEENVIVERLTKGSSQLDVVSMVGLPGTGKSTLARKVYDNLNVTCHFHFRAWCIVSQIYSKRGILLELLSHVDVLTDDISKFTDDDLLSKLRQYLLGNRYLIVMDDIWDTTAWHFLQSGFPDDSNGSRILITSRHQNVALKIKPDSDPHPIRPFSDFESWKLLEIKIFKGADCPEDLLEVGMEIAHNCQGLPLAVVLVAGLLKVLQRNKDSWTKVLKSFSLETISNPENRCKEILELSYKNLPGYLKACFIYLGVFLEGKDIPVTKLIHFWLAEGFLQETESKIMEEVAEDFLMQLINRSLVNIHKRGSNGKVKTCRLHDLLCDLCQLKAKEENFLQLVTRHAEPYATFPDTEDDMEFDSENIASPTTMFNAYRMSFCVKQPHFIDSRPSGLVTRSLIFFAPSDSESKFPYDISFICHNFKLLRILDLESIMAISFPAEIGLMIQLRYLAISGYMQSIPPSISKLWKLETLVVKGLRKVILPETIWSMAQLRHLHVNNHVIFSLPGLVEDVGSSFHLENLISFSTPSLTSRNDRWRILERLPNLRKLRCIFWQSKDSSESSELTRWNFLTHLESLKIICFGGTPSSRDFLLPKCLKKLTLSKFCIQENHLYVIGELPYLRVLKFRAGTFEGQKWHIREEAFKKLKFLELDTMDLVEWNAPCYELLPNLEQLVLRNCKNLKGIPSEFTSIVTLQKIEVHWCGKFVEVSAEAIGDETKEIKVVISRS